MIDYLGKVREFHEKFGHHLQEVPCYPEQKVIQLREKLILEEAQEFRDATTELEYDSLYGRKVKVEKLVAIADALGDLLYVVFGTALSYGIPIESVFSEVHRSNMTKSMLKDEKFVKGKTIKGPNYEPPDLTTIIEKAISG